jgi:ABC-type lipoprotein export system ATPase subunit
MNNSTILSGTDISKKFGDLDVVKGVTLSVNAAEFISITGKSGSGKTTLLSLLSGLEKPTSGKINLNGREIEDSSEDELALFRRENIGFIFQSFNLIPTLSAWENVALPLFPVKMTDKERRSRAAALLGKMEMEHRMTHLPSELSGGEKQRVAIARALINNPKIIFADEPTGNLDSATGEVIMKILTRLHKEESVAILMVTHDDGIARVADKLIHMKDGEIVS